MFKRSDQARQFGVTSIENIFITEYLPAASGEQIKVYLYGLYQSQNGADNFGVAELAAALSLEEGQVLASLRYWERRRLVERVKDDPPTYVFHHLGQRFMTGQDQLSGDEHYIMFSEAVNTQLGSRRKLRESDISMAYEWVEELQLPQEVVLMLLNHFADTRGAHFSFKSAQTTAVMMKEENITTTDEAEQYFSHSKKTHAGARGVLAEFNMRRLPTEPELALYRKWTEQWGFDKDAILLACQETVAANNPSFSYLNGILERLKNQLPSKEGSSVKKHLKQEGEDAALVREVLQELGKPGISPFTVLAAYNELRKDHSHEMILLAAKSVRSRGGMFEDLLPRLQSWRNMNLTDHKKVVAHLRSLKQYEVLMYTVFEQSGQEGRAGENDLMMLKGWLEDGHSEALITEAARQARSARQKLQYINKVLANWKKEGIKTVDAAQKAPAPAAQGRGKKVAFQDYDQGQQNAGQGYAGLDVLKEARELDGQ